MRICKLIIILFVCYFLKVVYATPHTQYKKIAHDNLWQMRFDFKYSGDVSGILEALHQYDDQLRILAPLGQSKPIVVNFDLQSANLNDIIDSLNNSTNNQVSVIYIQDQDTIRLSFNSVMDVGKDAVRESLKWQNGGTPKPVLKSDGIVRFPYGEYQPVVTCQPLNLCDIELQAGEEIQGIIVGDSQRWNEGDQGIPVVYSGVVPNLVPHLVLKPSQGGLDTTLMVTTTRRTYMFKLKSSETAYVARIGFYYPMEMVQKFEDKKSIMRDGGSVESTINVTHELKMPLVDLSKVSYHYIIKGDDYPWKPTQVFDDGISVYIQMPVAIDSRSLPGVCVLVDGGESNQCEMVNFRFNQHFYIIDKLFNRVKLINGFGDSMQTITIEHNPKPSFWARLFGSK